MTDPNHTDTSRSGDLVADIRKQAAIQIGFDGPAYQTLTRWADRIEALEAENERLRYHLEGTLETLLDAEVCSTDCVPCNEARAALGEKQ